MFKHKKIDYEFPKLECVTKETGRTYQTPEGNIYPSITTILSANKGDGGLEQTVSVFGMESYL